MYQLNTFFNQGTELNLTFEDFFVFEKCSLKNIKKHHHKTNKYYSLCSELRILFNQKLCVFKNHHNFKK